MPGQGKNPGKSKREFHVSALEVKGVHISGGTRTVTVVWPMWDAHAGGETL